MTRRMRHALLAVAVLAGSASFMAVVACPGVRSTPQGCTKDTDCKGTRICVRSACTEPVASTKPAVAGDAGLQPAKDPGPGSPPFAMYAGNAQNTGQLAGPVPDKKPAMTWMFKVGGPIVGSPTVGPDGTIFATSHDGHLYGVSPAGKELWRFKTGDRVWSTPAVAQDGTVYTGSDDDHLYAIDGATGKQKWRLRIGNCENPTGFGPEGVRCDVDGGPTLGPDGTIYVGGDGVYAIWPNGTLRWKFATPEHVSAAPALAPDGTIYAACQDDAVYAIRPDGTKIWDFRTSRDIESAPTIGADGTIYFGGDDDAVYALEVDGTVKWKVVTGGDVRSSPAVATDGTIYVGSYDKKLYAIASNGEVKWRLAAAGKIHGAPAIGTNGTILVGAHDDHLYAVSPDGKLLWYLAFDKDVDATPAVSADGVIYAGSDDGTLRAFGAAPAGK